MVRTLLSVYLTVNVGHMSSKIGKLIKSARKEKGLGLRELARRIGKSPAYLVSLERAELSPGTSDETLQSLATELGLDPDSLHAAVHRTPENVAPKSSTQVALYRLIEALPQYRQIELKGQLETELQRQKLKRDPQTKT